MEIEYMDEFAGFAGMYRSDGEGVLLDYPLSDAEIEMMFTNWGDSICFDSWRWASMVHLQEPMLMYLFFMSIQTIFLNRYFYRYLPKHKNK